jgi:hypothetical protein
LLWYVCIRALTQVCTCTKPNGAIVAEVNTPKGTGQQINVYTAQASFPISLETLCSRNKKIHATSDNKSEISIEKKQKQWGEEISTCQDKGTLGPHARSLGRMAIDQ